MNTKTHLFRISEATILYFNAFDLNTLFQQKRETLQTRKSKSKMQHLFGQ